MLPYKVTINTGRGSSSQPQTALLKKSIGFRSRPVANIFQLPHSYNISDHNNLRQGEFHQQNHQKKIISGQILSDNIMDTQHKNIFNKMFSTMIQNQNENSKQLTKINQSIEEMVKLMQKKWGEPYIEQNSSEDKKQQIQSDAKRNRLENEQYQNSTLTNNRTDINNYSQLLQLRFRNIDLDLPSKNGINDILTWIGEVCRRVFSVGFTLFKNGELEEQKIKIYCSQNILRNIIKLSKHKKLSPQQFQKIDNCIKNELLPYFCYKYPQTEERKASSKFGNILIEKDTLNQNENDLCSKSRIDFSYEEDGNYNSQIMKFFNFIIGLTGMLPGLVSNQKNQIDTLGQLFKKDMGTIFQSIQHQETFLQMYDYKPNGEKKQIKNLSIKQSLNLQQKSLPPHSQQIKRQKLYQKRNQASIKYQQKVRQYTTYQIGQKLNQVTPFTQYEIQMGELKLNNTALMRVATKWCSQLEKCFEPNEILNRETQWKMKDASEKYMKKQRMIILNILLQNQKIQIDRQMNKIKANNYKNQMFFSQKPIKQQLNKFSQEEAIVGQFTTSIFKINQNYLIKYLNLLIHGINRALKDFETIQRVFDQETSVTQRSYQLIEQPQNIYETQQNIIKVNQLVDYTRLVIKSSDKYPVQNTSETPQLIMFKVGDLMRCKCTSKQTQIITLYKIVEYLNTYHPNFIRILKVRNKLDQGNKDILMNLMYRNSMIVEMQLAIKSEKSKFVEYSNKFNHYFYEMKRAQFGPIMEMCSIWASHDQRAQFYFDSMRQNNIRKKEGELKQCCSQQCLPKSIQQLFSIPFKCSSCQYFYFQCNFYQRHFQCKKCGLICFKCRIQQLKDRQNRDQLPALLSSYSYQKQINICKQLPQKGGQILNINSKDKILKTFKTLLYKNQYYLFYYSSNKKNQKELQVIKSFKKGKQRQDFKAFSLTHIILQNFPQSEQIYNLTLEKAQRQYFLPKYLQQVKKSEKKSFALIKKDIKKDFFSLKKQQKVPLLQSVSKLNLSENKFQQVLILSQMFPNLEVAAINNNKIQKLEKQHIGNWQHTLTGMFLKNNKITQIDGIEKLKKLCYLDLQGNLIQQFPNIAPKKLKRINLKRNQLKSLPQNFGSMNQLTQLYLSHNQIRKLPETLMNLKNLKQLNISWNLLVQLPNSINKLENLQKLQISNNFELGNLPETFDQLKNLRQLKIGGNNLEYLPESFGNFEKLKTLQARKNKIIKLPDSFGRLNNLEVLDLSYNKLSGLPDTFKNLKNLRSLSICHNRIQQLPEFFENLQMLQRLQMASNRLSRLPTSFGNLKNLKFLSLSQNRISEIPQSFVNMIKIQQLHLQFNSLVKLPKFFGKLLNLRNLSLFSNKINQLPESFGNLLLLDFLKLQRNCLEKLPQSFGNLKNLFSLDINQNNISQLPQSFGKLKNLSSLDINSNKICLLPQSFGNLLSLQHLLISRNELSQFPESFINLSKLKRLQIQQNKICENFEELTKLMKLPHLKIVSLSEIEQPLKTKIDKLFKEKHIQVIFG